MKEIFSLTPHKISELGSQLLAQTKANGATAAAMAITETSGHSIHYRQNRIQALSREIRCNISLTVFKGHHQGQAHSSDLTSSGLEKLASAACEIANCTEEDPFAGLPAPDTLSTVERDLEIFHPWTPESETLITLAQEVESGMVGHANTASNGVWISASQTQFWLVNSLGFNRGMQLSEHGVAATAIASKNEIRTLEFSSHQGRKTADFPELRNIGAEAADLARRSLDQRKICTGDYPILFSAKAATGLIGHLCQAISGHALYMGNSFLQEHFDTQLFPSHIQIREDPFLPCGNASALFDSEGVAGRQRLIVTDGKLRHKLLGSYSARRLQEQSTGNAGGPYNMHFHSTLTQPGDDFSTMLRKLGTGLYVTSLSGEGVHLANGDYSRAAKGFWVRNGEIEHAVSGVTIAGNLLDMWKNIIAIGSDVITEGPFSSGSTLIGQMRVAG